MRVSGSKDAPDAILQREGRVKWATTLDTPPTRFSARQTCLSFVIQRLVTLSQTPRKGESPVVWDSEMFCRKMDALHFGGPASHCRDPLAVISPQIRQRHFSSLGKQ